MWFLPPLVPYAIGIEYLQQTKYYACRLQGVQYTLTLDNYNACQDVGVKPIHFPEFENISSVHSYTLHE